MPTRPERRLLGRYSDRSRLLGWILLLLSLIVILVGNSIPDPWGTVVVAFGGSMVPAAVLNAWLDPLLREQAAMDIYDVLQIKESVATSGILRVESATKVDLDAQLRNATRIDVLPLHARDWAKRDFERIRAACAHRAISVRVFLSAPEAEWCAVDAHRTRGDAEAVARELLQLPDQILGSWDRGATHPQSSIEVFYYNGVPSIGLSATDGFVAVELGAAVREEEVPQASQTLVFEADSSIGKWVIRQLEFQADLDEPPTSAGVRPLTIAAANVGTPARGVGADGGNSA